VERRIVHSPLFQPPLHLFSPSITGSLGNYYEWIAAGYYKSTEGSTHRGNRLIDRLRYGFDEKKFYFRAEGNFEAVRTSREDISLVLEIQNPRSLRVVYKSGRLDVLPWKSNGAAEPMGTFLGQASHGTAAIGAVVEAGIPLEELGTRSGDFLDFAVSLRAGNEAIDRLPQAGFITVSVPPPDFGGENWSA